MGICEVDCAVCSILSDVACLQSCYICSLAAGCTNLHSVCCKLSRNALLSALRAAPAATTMAARISRRTWEACACVAHLPASTSRSRHRSSSSEQCRSCCGAAGYPPGDASVLCSSRRCSEQQPVDCLQSVVHSDAVWCRWSELGPSHGNAV
jgi:hypothetical protein